MAAKVKALQQWCKVQCDGYRDVNITNMTSSFRSGLAFCAIIHRYRPDLIPYDSLSKQNIFENNKLAFEVGEKLGIAALLDPEDMVAMAVPDKLCILTYVSQYYTCFRNQKPVSDLHGMEVAPVAVKRSIEQPTVHEPYNKKVATSGQAGGEKRSMMEDKCSICFKKVFLMERSIDSNKLYHRQCLRDGQKRQSSILRTTIRDENMEPTDDEHVAQHIPPRSSEHVSDKENKPTPEAEKIVESVDMEDEKENGLSLKHTTVKSNVTCEPGLVASESGSQTKSDKPLMNSSVPPTVINSLPSISSSYNGSSSGNIAVASDPTITSVERSKANLEAPTSSNKSTVLDSSKTKAIQSSTPISSVSMLPGGAQTSSSSIVTTSTFVWCNRQTSMSDKLPVDRSLPAIKDAHVAPTNTDIVPVATDIGPCSSVCSIRLDDSAAVNKNNEIVSGLPTIGVDIPGVTLTSQSNSVGASSLQTRHIQPRLPVNRPITSSKPNVTPVIGSITIMQPSSVTSVQSDVNKTSGISPGPTNCVESPHVVPIPQSNSTGASSQNIQSQPKTDCQSVVTSESSAIVRPHTNTTTSVSIKRVSSIEVPPRPARELVAKTINGHAKMSTVQANDIVTTKTNDSNHENSALGVLTKEPESVVSRNCSETTAPEKPRHLSDQSEDDKKVVSGLMKSLAIIRNKSQSGERECGQVLNPRQAEEEPHGDPGASHISASNPKVPSKTIPPPVVPPRHPKSILKTSSKFMTANTEWKSLTESSVERTVADKENICTDKKAAVDIFKQNDLPQPPKPQPRNIQRKQLDLVSIKSESSSETGNLDTMQMVKPTAPIRPARPPGVPRPVHDNVALPQTSQTKLTENDDNLNSNSTLVVTSTDISTTPIPSVSPVPQKRKAPPPPRPQLPAPVTSPPPPANVVSPPLPPPRPQPPAEEDLNRTRKKITPDVKFKFESFNFGRKQRRVSDDLSDDFDPMNCGDAHPYQKVIKRKICTESRLPMHYITRKLKDLDSKLKDMETRGRVLEEKIRSGTDEAMEDDDDLMVQWFDMVNNKNDLVREESELMHQCRQQELETRHEEVEFELRRLMAIPDEKKTVSDRAKEDQLIKELVETVSQRNTVVESIEEDRLRYLQEDEEICQMMASKGFQTTEKHKKGKVVKKVSNSKFYVKSKSETASG